MQRLEVSGAVRPIYGSLGVKRLISTTYIGNDPANLAGCYFSCLMYLEEESRNVYKQTLQFALTGRLSYIFPVAVFP
jgi:hypothetical protein